MAKKHDYVQIHRIVLEPDARADTIPEDTHSVPLEMWVKGYLNEESAKIGDEVTITTRTGRQVKGVLVDEAPHYTHSFGNLVPELLRVGDQVRGILFGEESGESKMRDTSYQAVMQRKNEIMKKSVGMDYGKYESGSIAFDYEGMMRDTGYTIDEVIRIQRASSIGDTRIMELKNITALARKCAKPGKGARIFIKDEAANPSGSFKVRRAAISVYQAKKMGYKGVITATSGNYGAAVASVCAMAGLKCIVVQECFDSKGKGQPEIIEKARKCEALGAEVVQLSVGPELFYSVLLMLEETGYFNASLYTPFGIAGVESLGYEIAHQFRKDYNCDPDVVVCSNAGGGNLTGTARGLRKANCHPQIVAASVNLKGCTWLPIRSSTESHSRRAIRASVCPSRRIPTVLMFREAPQDPCAIWTDTLP